ncbi:unnamed protein product [Sphenostylis stenocarpa]|uniref:Uncharacterized protein n=1 Tax=Sphenostylis stenocarpa TaxID=92480 RepID=A0AA87B6U5_9FABA|nr:unnamed protein product [Sphenostylis stenocarpa]
MQKQEQWLATKLSSCSSPTKEANGGEYPIPHDIKKKTKSLLSLPIYPASPQLINSNITVFEKYVRKLVQSRRAIELSSTPTQKDMWLERQNKAHHCTLPHTRKARCS